jgi:hypothetical protein
MSLKAKLDHLEKIIGFDAAKEHRLSIEDITDLYRWLEQQGFGIGDYMSPRDHKENIRVLRAALAAGLRTPPQFYLTIEDLLEAEEHVVAYREMRFGKGA